jgi:hypothetical protein
MALDLFRLTFVNPHQLAPRPVLRLQELVELGLYGLGITALGTLDEQRHQPGPQSGKAVPIQTIARKKCPRQRIDADDHEGGRVRGENSEACHDLADWIGHSALPVCQVPVNRPPMGWVPALSRIGPTS